MLKILPEELKNLAKACPKSLYAVGGSVRDFLAALTPSARDWDICAPMRAEEFSALAEENGLEVRAIYKNTGTVKLKGKEGEYEYSCFRSDKYVRGTHTPVEIFFTEDITLDARRRDFTVNAVYFDIKEGEFVDPLQGIAAVKERRLTTVDDPKKVFGEDGLRLMRLARQAAQLGFTPDQDCLDGAKENADLILDITPERTFEELVQLLIADRKYGVKGAPYHGLKVMEETGILDRVFPELAKGKGLAQRADYHKYDVLEHSLRAVKYAEALDGSYLFRLAALLHDVGKPFCMLQKGNAYMHPEEGAELAREILTRLKAPKKTVETVAWLTRWHMYDYDCQASESKVRRFLVKNVGQLPLLLKLKQADFSACCDDLAPAPTRVKWEKTFAKMQTEKTPFSLKELSVDGDDLLRAGILPRRVGAILQELLMHTAVFPNENEKARLLRLVKGLDKTLP